MESDSRVVSNLMSMAFNNDFGVEIINTNEGLRVSLLINPYDVEAKVECMKKVLKSQQEVDPIVSTMLDYVRCIAPNMKKEFRVNFCKFEDGSIIFEEVNKERGTIRGYWTQEEFIEFYEEQSKLEGVKANELKPVLQVKAGEIARIALNFVNRKPGSLSISMRHILDNIRRMFEGKSDILEK